MSASAESHTCWCGRSYLRKEHLQRHKATHNRPSFSCPSCDKSFTRLDLLRRHSQIHGSVVPDSRKEPACDACHASKIKCDGGPKCSLCKKRDVECTYNRSSLAKRLAPEKPPANAVPNSGQVDPPRDPLTPIVQVTPDFISSPDLNQGNNTTDSQIWNTKTKSGAKALAQALSAARQGRETELLTNAPAWLESWLDECAAYYLGQFHERWPLLHSPVICEDRHDTLHVIITTVIGAWQHDNDNRSRAMLMAIHKALMKHLISLMAKCSFGSSKPWPLEQYQASLLCAIFVMEIAENTLMSDARMLHGLVVTALRQTRMLSSDAAKLHQKTHKPGDFPPWVYAMHELWKQLAKCALRVEVYFSFSTYQSPSLDLQELNLDLTSTWALWNANGLHMFFPRAQLEPMERSQYRMAQLAGFTGPRIPFTFLAEDVEVILLGMTKDIWLYGQSRRNTFFTGEALEVQKDRLLLQLGFARDQLNRLAALPNDASVETTQYIFQFYAGFETGLGWKEATAARFSRFVLRGMFLYSLLDLHIWADMEHLSDILRVSDNDYNTYGEQSLQKQSAAAHWALSAGGRTAVLRALLTLRLYENIKTRQSSIEENDPVTQLALVGAAVVIRAWVPRAIPSCTCDANVSTTEIAIAPDLLPQSPCLDSWKTNGGKIVYGGVNLCCCNLGDWRQRFAEKLKSDGRTKHLNEIWSVTD